MNPNAKEFVPAHILKKRQEEADAKRLGEITEKLDEVKLGNGEEKDDDKSRVQEKTKSDEKQERNSDDDRYLLKAGENYCEFNGEEFIVPGDDDEGQYEGDLPDPGGYDFGNDTDNQDEEIANAFEEFLETLPDPARQQQRQVTN